ncbi:hypothetical protein [Flavobacterium sp. CAN_S2]|uniref:hypothetical protein n=1 Tax=Flavobacterium sp. CAN_S2 TaxID=2787726 RepID=UPI0018CA2FB7
MKKSMIKIYFSIICLIYVSIVYPQKNYSDAILIDIKNDTINCKIKINYNFLNKKYLDDAAYFRGVTIVNDEGNAIEKIPAIYINQVRFTDIFNIERVYLNNGVLFKQLLFNGVKLKWYRTMTEDLWNGPSFKNYLMNENGRIFKIETLRIKKTLKEATISKPELVSQIDSISLWVKNIDVDILKVLKKNEE